MKHVFAISFIPEYISKNRIILKTGHIIDGEDGDFTDNTIVDYYGGTFSPIQFTADLDEYSSMYGLMITEEQLVEYAKSKNFPENIIEFPELCAKLYFNSLSEYVFILEQHENLETYAFNLQDKSVVLIDINKEGITQLIEPNSEKRIAAIKEKLDQKIEEEIVEQQEEVVEETKSSFFVNRRELFNKITSRVIGQDEAAFRLVQAICDNQKYGHYEGEKINVLLYGPSGCGKTELIRSLSRELDIPFIVEDMTNYTASGYVGDSIKKIFRRLYFESGNDLTKAEHGIVVLDEVDKLASVDSTKTVNTTDVQQELLKVMEGTMVDLNDSNKTVEQFNMNTANITFILCGAFSGFSSKKQPNSVGFSSQIVKEEQSTIMTTKDFKEYGLLPEFIGRISCIAPIKPLGKKELEDILNKSSISSLKIKEKAFLNEDKVTIVYNDKNKFISRIAEKASTLGVGARGLKMVVDDVFLDAKAEINDDKPNERELIISSDMVEDSKAYVLKKKKRGNKHEFSIRNGKGIIKNNK